MYKNLDVNSQKITQIEITAVLSDPELSGAFLNSVNSSFKKRRKSHCCSSKKQVLVTESQALSGPEPLT